MFACGPLVRTDVEDGAGKRGWHAGAAPRDRLEGHVSRSVRVITLCFVGVALGPRDGCGGVVACAGTARDGHAGRVTRSARRERRPVPPKRSLTGRVSIYASLGKLADATTQDLARARLWKSPSCWAAGNPRRCCRPRRRERLCPATHARPRHLPAQAWRWRRERRERHNDTCRGASPRRGVNATASAACAVD